MATRTDAGLSRNETAVLLGKTPEAVGQRLQLAPRKAVKKAAKKR